MSPLGDQAAPKKTSTIFYIKCFTSKPANFWLGSYYEWGLKSWLEALRTKKKREKKEVKKKRKEKRLWGDRNNTYNQKKQKQEKKKLYLQSYKTAHTLNKNRR